jgi:hypothetical protein
MNGDRVVLRSAFYVLRSCPGLRPAVGLWFHARPEIQNQPGVHHSRALGEGDNTSHVGFGEVLSIQAVEERRFGFVQFAARDLAASSKVFGTKTSKAFGDIARRGRGRPSELIAESKISRGRTRLSECEDFSLHFIRELPSLKLLETCGGHGNGRMHKRFHGGSGRKSEKNGGHAERRTQNVERHHHDAVALYAA